MHRWNLCLEGSTQYSLWWGGLVHSRTAYCHGRQWDQIIGTYSERLLSQGEVPFLLLWSMAMDNFLVELNFHRIYAQRYTDDVCIVGVVHFPNSVGYWAGGPEETGRGYVKTGHSVNANKMNLMIFMGKWMLGNVWLAILNNTVLVPSVSEISRWPWTRHCDPAHYQ